MAFDRDLDLFLSDPGHAFSGCSDGRIYCGFLWSGIHAGSGGGIILGSGGSRRRIWNDRELVEYGGIQIQAQIPLISYKSLQICILWMLKQSRTG